MRIAIFTDTYLPQVNGVTHTLSKLQAYLIEEGHDYKLFAPDYGKEKEHLTAPSVVRFKSILFPPYPECRISLPFYTAITKEVSDFQPDLIHIVTPLGIGLTGLKYGKKHKLPIVASFHTNFDAYLKYYKLDLFEDLLWKFFKKFHDQCLLNFCPSNDTMEALSSKGIKDLRLWTRGIDTSHFSPSNYSEDFLDTHSYSRRTPYKKNAKEPIRFLYTGRVSLEKDLDILLQASHRINRKYKTQIEFIIVGDGPYKKQMMALAPDNMTFTGYLKGQELYESYASCDVFAFPSATETLGNVVLEAMASGLPVIAVNSGGVKDNVHPNYNGILARPRDVESFTDAIEELILHPERRQAYKHNALEYVKSRTWDAIFDQLISDYETVIPPSACSQVTISA